MTTRQEYICNQLKEKGPSYFSLDDGYGVISSLTPDEEKKFESSDSNNDMIKMQKYDNEDNLLMTIYCYSGRMDEFHCDTNDRMTILYALAPKRSFPIEIPEMEYIKWTDKTDNFVMLDYNVGDSKEETKNNFLAASRKQGVASIEALKTYALIREACDFQREGTISILRDGHYSKNELPRFNKSR